MLNIPKENVKAFITIVTGVAILIFISLFIDIKFIFKSVFDEPEPDLTKYNNTAESKVEENKYNLISEERRLLYYTDEIVAMINNKEFSKLYSILEENYRNLYVKSVAELEEDMARFADGEYSLSYDEYYKEGNMFLIDARFERVNMTRQDIVNGVKTPIDTLCIREIEKGKYTVAFNSFISKSKINKEKSNNLIKVKVDEMTVKADSTELVIHVENLTNEKVTLYDDRLDIYLVHSGNFKYVNPNTITKELAPNASTIYKLTFRNIYCKDSAPKSLKFNRVYASDGKIKKLEIKL